jgi:hypothetical protein
MIALFQARLARMQTDPADAEQLAQLREAVWQK